MTESECWTLVDLYGDPEVEIRYDDVLVNIVSTSKAYRLITFESGAGWPRPLYMRSIDDFTFARRFDPWQVIA